MAPPGDDSGYHEEGNDWFAAPPPPGATLGFQTAKKVAETASTPTDDPMDPDGDNPFREATVSKSDAVPAFAGFQTSASLLNPSKTGRTVWSAPSAEALAKAAERMKRWEAEIDKELAAPSVPAEPTPSLDAGSASQPAFGRIVLKDVENSTAQLSSQPLSQLEPPDTPTPVRTAFKPPSATPFGGAGRKPFKSPMLTRPAAGPSTPAFASPLNPHRAGPSSGFKPPSFTTPIKAAFPTPLGSASTSTASPAKRSLGLTPRRLGVGSPLKKPAFVTPFKAGMRPGDPGRAQLEASQRVVAQKANTPLVVGVVPTVFRTPAKQDKGKGRMSFFDLGEELPLIAPGNIGLYARI